MLKKAEMYADKKYSANIFYNAQNDSFSIIINESNLQMLSSSLTTNLLLNETQAYSCQTCGGTYTITCANKYTRTTSGMNSAPPITVTSNGNGCYTWS